MSHEQERERIIARVRRLRDDIQIDLNTVEHWNQHVRTPHEAPLDPDPGGDMRRLLAAIDEMLAKDPGHGPLAPIVFERSH